MIKINKIPKVYGFAGLGVLVLIIAFVFWPSTLTYDTAEVESIPFNMEVIGEGEVQALKYEQILIPELLKRRELRIWDVKITNLIGEGTKVKKGDFVASLDPSGVEDRIRKSLEKIDEYENTLESAILDSTIVLMEKREDIVNTLDNLEECKIRVEQSKYESRATQRQANIALEKAQLDINTKKRNYEKETQRQKVKISRANKRLNSEREVQGLLQALKKQLRVVSPSSGMVVYGKSWRGNKIKVNDHVGPWMPLIATIPDLNSLVSEVIVKEIDIAKVQIGQKVRIVIDAFPDDLFDGEIKNIANIGQPIKGAGMNGFKVIVELETKGKKILPSMTTTNNIVIASFEKELVVPRMAVFTEGDTQIVFKKKGTSVVKQVIQTGGENETHIRIVSGLQNGDQVLLSRPKSFQEETLM
ncbi:efflux RND transporter periplasmic adaptor subunit [Labilibacter marinus]|uniref:efflux RND transporter periplasmic adaptor subunit n=1 Tax=Labilibacter marinus TaxID=1477105 RepID=UPI00082FA657|nr:efflux RND transporter periplasmic adaptor subunit [Labilibacter marinus]